MATQLLTLLLLGVTLAVSADPNEQDAKLRAFQITCKDCSTLLYGDPAGTVPLVEHPCPTGTVCGPSGAAHSCIPEDSDDAASCSCGGQETAYIPEPYDPSKYIACLPGGGQSILECAAGQIFTGEIDAPCAAGPECKAPAVAGFNPLTPDCTKYFFCDKVEAGEAPAPGERRLREDAVSVVPTFECAAGQVFDVAMLGCVDPCTLAPEPFACKPEDSGPFPDPEDCTIFHLCFMGAQIGDPIACPPDQFYNADPTVSACAAGTKEEICTSQTLNVCFEPYQAECAGAA